MTDDNKPATDVVRDKAGKPTYSSEIRGLIRAHHPDTKLREAVKEYVDALVAFGMGGCAEMDKTLQGPFDKMCAALSETPGEEQKDVLDLTILAHCTEIKAAVDRIKCWECGGCGKVFWQQTDQATGDHAGQAEAPCPTCHGEGYHNVKWEPPCESQS